MTLHAIQCLSAAVVLAGMAAFMPACAKEVAHTESDKTGLFGQQTHTEDTTYQNPDGTISTVHDQTKVQP